MAIVVIMIQSLWLMAVMMLVCGKIQCSQDESLKNHGWLWCGEWLQLHGIIMSQPHDRHVCVAVGIVQQSFGIHAIIWLQELDKLGLSLWFPSMLPKGNSAILCRLLIV